MSYAPLVPATLAFNDAGVPWSAQYGDVYHSADGGLAQARQVFLAGNDLPLRWRGRNAFTIFETGFGLGLNFLATWQAWREDPLRCARLHFVSVEKHPFSRADLAALHGRWPELAAQAGELQAAWPVLTPGAHRLLLDQGRVTLTLFFGDASRIIRKLRVGAQAVYLDGFAPARNPELWDPYLLKAVTRLCVPGATLATWSVAAGVRDALSAQRWRLEKLPGFGHKREMLRGRLHGEETIGDGPRRALVIGAGLAGASVAERLAARDWQVEVIERHPAPAMEASGNPAGLLHPMLSSDDNHAARISRSAYLFALSRLAELASRDHGLRWRDCGVMQLARDAEQEAAQRQACEALALPAEYLRFVDRNIARQAIGHEVAAGGWHYPQGGWVAPATLCSALLKHERVRLRAGTAVARALHQDGQWICEDEHGGILAQAPLLIVAAAFDALKLFPDLQLPLTRLRGQVSFLPAGSLPFLHHVVCGNGYVTPDDIGMHCLGATYDFTSSDPAPTLESHETNLRHLAELLPGIGVAKLDPASLAGRVGFRTMTTDRLPLVGALPQVPLTLRREARLREVIRLPGLHALLGLGSRGLLWSQLAAELLASQLCGEPMPLEGDLVDAVDPARFLMRARKRQSA